MSRRLASQICSLVDNKAMSIPQTELDSHTINICVFGKDYIVISESKRTVGVRAFTSAAGGLTKVPIADALVTYDYKRTNQVYLLVVRNVLYIEQVENNIILPFILQEAGLEVNNIPKIHSGRDGATPDDHKIQELKSSFFIPLYLDGIFSVWDLEDCVVVLVTPKNISCNPYDKTFIDNEALLADTKGNLLPSEYIHCEMIVKDDYISNSMIFIKARIRHIHKFGRTCHFT